MDWGGLIVGFALGLLGTGALDLWREKRQANAVRVMLRLEIEGNVQTLEDLNKALPKRGKPVLVEEFPENRNRREHAEAQHRAAALVDRPLPPWSQDVWKSQIALIPRVLKPREIIQVAAFYGALGELAALRTSLGDAAAADHKLNLAREPVRPWTGEISELDKRVSQTRVKIMNLDAEALAKGRACLSFLR